MVTISSFFISKNAPTITRIIQTIIFINIEAVAIIGPWINPMESDANSIPKVNSNNNIYNWVDSWRIFFKAIFDHSNSQIFIKMCPIFMACLDWNSIQRAKFLESTYRTLILDLSTRIVCLISAAMMSWVRVWVEFELSWLFTNRSGGFYLICRK